MWADLASLAARASSVPHAALWAAAGATGAVCLCAARARAADDGPGGSARGVDAWDELALLGERLRATAAAEERLLQAGHALETLQGGGEPAGGAGSSVARLELGPTVLARIEAARQEAGVGQSLPCGCTAEELLHQVRQGNIPPRSTFSATDSVFRSSASTCWSRCR